jgi:soluble lytic murein transglycosylase-like protein
MLTSRKLLHGSLRLSAIAPLFSGLILGQSTVPPRSVQTQEESVRRMEKSIERQKAAVVKHSGTPLIVLTPAPTVACEPIDENDLNATLDEAANRERVDPTVLREVIRQESAFCPNAVSPKGAMGLMQLMPATAGQFHVTDPFDIEQNVAAGAHYLKQLLDRYHGDLKLALAAYNAGPGRVDTSVPDIPETINYVTQIMKALEKVK